MRYEQEGSNLSANNVMMRELRGAGRIRALLDLSPD